MDTFERKKASDLIHKVIEKDGLVLEMIDLPVSLPGFEHHITSWLLQDREREQNFLLDPGPAVSNPALEHVLKERGIKRLDYILLTHVHLDHAGGIGHMMKTWPDAKIVVPWKGRKHLVDPSGLWKGSVKTLGEVAVTFGELLAVSADSFHSDEIEIPGLTIFQTPGHASHHQSYLYEATGERVFFPGEAAGVILGKDMLPLWISCDRDPGKVQPPVTELEDVIYMSPASPPVFNLDIAISSLALLMEYESSIMCYSHYGYTRFPGLAMSLHMQQLKLWKDIIKGAKRETAGLDEEETVELALKLLMASDGFLSTFSFFDSEVQQKELFFLRSGIRGFLGYLGEN